jgi:hypothetical protein
MELGVQMTISQRFFIVVPRGFEKSSPERRIVLPGRP